jgi:hypothetical protein
VGRPPFAEHACFWQDQSGRRPAKDAAMFDSLPEMIRNILPAVIK